MENSADDPAALNAVALKELETASDSIRFNLFFAGDAIEKALFTGQNSDDSLIALSSLLKELTYKWGEFNDMRCAVAPPPTVENDNGVVDEVD